MTTKQVLKEWSKRLRKYRWEKKIKNYLTLLKTIFYGRPDRYPNLGARKQILKYKKGNKGRLAIWHIDKQKWLDKEGNEYRSEELY